MLLFTAAGVKVTDFGLLFLLALPSYTGSKSSHMSLLFRNDAVVVTSWVFMGFMDVYWSLWVSMGAYGYLCVFIGIYGSL